MNTMLVCAFLPRSVGRILLDSGTTTTPGITFGLIPVSRGRVGPPPGTGTPMAELRTCCAAMVAGYSTAAAHKVDVRILDRLARGRMKTSFFNNRKLTVTRYASQFPHREIVICSASRYDDGSDQAEPGRTTVGSVRGGAKDWIEASRVASVLASTELQSIRH